MRVKERVIIKNIIIRTLLIYVCLSWRRLGFSGGGLGLTFTRKIRAVVIIIVLAPVSYKNLDVYK